MVNPSYLVVAVLLVACSIPDVTFTNGANCFRLEATCGARQDDSCCTSPEVPGGTYYRGYDRAGDPSTSGDTSAPATVGTFRLDKYEVTVGRFRAFVNAGMGTQASPPRPSAGAHAHIVASGWDPSWNMNLATDTAALKADLKCSPWQTWTDSPAANENRPMNCLTWYEAMAFCIWDSGYLPTEAEWNYAAAGGDQQRAYPWSNPAGSLTPLDGSHASYNDGTNCVGDGEPGCSVTDMVAVGSKPLGDGRWGQSDLAGNVWEWTLDWFAKYVARCMDCAGLTATSERVIRGGSLFGDATSIRTGFRFQNPPMSRANIGVRCARAP